MRNFSEITYGVRARPACAVRFKERWYAGEVRSWSYTEGQWWAVVTLHTGVDAAHMLRLPASEVRPLDTDDADWD